MGLCRLLFYFAIKEHIICVSTLVTLWRGLRSLQDLCVFWSVFYILGKIALLIVTLIWNCGSKHSWASAAILRKIWWGSNLNINLWQVFKNIKEQRTEVLGTIFWKINTCLACKDLGPDPLSCCKFDFHKRWGSAEFLFHTLQAHSSTKGICQGLVIHGWLLPVGLQQEQESWLRGGWRYQNVPWQL